MITNTGLPVDSGDPFKVVMDSFNRFNRGDAIADISLYSAPKPEQITLLECVYGFHVSVHEIYLFQLTDRNSGKRAPVATTGFQSGELKSGTGLHCKDSGENPG